MSKTYTNVEIVEKPASLLELSVSIPWTEVEKYRNKVLKKLKEGKEIKGFRKGSAPDALVIKEVGEDAVVYRQAVEALEKAYLDVVEDKKLDLIGRPKITITKLAPNNPLEFKAEVVKVPEVKLPEYKAIAEKIERKEVSLEDKEFQDAVEHLRQQWARSEKYEKLKQSSEDKDSIHPHDIEVTEEELPALDEEFVKKLGNFSTVDEFNEKLKENMRSEKNLRENERRRIEILESIRKETEVEVPDLLIMEELENMLNSFKSDVERAGLKLEEYLKQVHKTEEDLKNEWRADATKRVETELILDAIARKEDIKPDDEHVREEFQKIVNSYPDIDPLRAAIYVRTVLTNQKVLEFLESNAPKA